MFWAQVTGGTIGTGYDVFFAPEPSRWLLLAAGLGFLAVLYRVRERRRE